MQIRKTLILTLLCLSNLFFAAAPINYAYVEDKNIVPILQKFREQQVETIGLTLQRPIAMEGFSDPQEELTVLRNNPQKFAFFMPKIN